MELVIYTARIKNANTHDGTCDLYRKNFVIYTARIQNSNTHDMCADFDVTLN